MSDWEDAATAERILAQTTAVLANRGDEQAVALLIDARSLEFVNTEEVAASWHDQVWGETMRYEYFLDAKLDVEDHLVAGSPAMCASGSLPSWATWRSETT